MWVSGLYLKGLLKVTESIKHEELKTTCLWRLYTSKQNKDIFSLISSFPKLTRNITFGCPPPSPARCSAHHLPLCMGDRAQHPTGCCWDRAGTSAAVQAWDCPVVQLTACFPKPPESASQIAEHIFSPRPPDCSIHPPLQSSKKYAMHSHAHMVFILHLFLLLKLKEGEGKVKIPIPNWILHVWRELYRLKCVKSPHS